MFKDIIGILIGEVILLSIVCGKNCSQVKILFALVSPFVIYFLYKINSISKEKQKEIQEEDNNTAKIKLSDNDTYDLVVDININEYFKLEYRKANGELTKRKVRTSRVYSYYCYWYIFGYCYLRNENRTFRVDRIEKCFNAYTEENIDFVMQYLFNKYTKKFLNKISDTEIFLLNTISRYDTNIQEGYFYGLVDDYLDFSKYLKIKHKKVENYLEINTLKIGYTNTKEIFVLAINKESDDYTTFYSNNLKELIDMDTGEVLSENKDINIFFSNTIEQIKEKSLEKERIDNIKMLFFKDNRRLFEILFYIARNNGNLNAKKILKKYIKKLPNSDIVKIDDIFINSLNKETKKIKYEGFRNRVNEILKNNNFNIDILQFANEIVSTQKSILDEEEKLFKYLDKKYEKNTFNFKIKYKGLECEYCGSKHTIKKGIRNYKNYNSQRYQCQECGKIFSTPIMP